MLSSWQVAAEHDFGRYHGSRVPSKCYDWVEIGLFSKWQLTGWMAFFHQSVSWSSRLPNKLFYYRHNVLKSRRKISFWNLYHAGQHPWSDWLPWQSSSVM